MASFNEQESLDQPLDFTVLRDGGISLYKRADLLDADTEILIQKGYRVVTFDTSRWISEAAMHQSLAESLDFPSHYGANFDALNDCLCNDLHISQKGGLLIRLLNALPTSQNLIVADIMARAIRRYMLTGQRLILFVQTSDAQASFSNLGATTAIWNAREWLTTART